MASVNLDLHYVEIAIKGSQLMFLNLSDRGASAGPSLSNLQQGVLAEVGRYYVTRNHHFGRLAAGYTQFSPSGQHYIKIGTDAGIFPSLNFPWGLRLSANTFLNPPTNTFLLIRGETLRSLSEALDLGGFLALGYRIRLAQSLGTYENMELSVGPRVYWKTALGNFAGELIFRIWLDTYNYNKPDGTQTSGIASDFSGLPDLRISWSLSW
jgi:hypothetical protein